MAFLDEGIQKEIKKEHILFNFNPADCNKLYFKELINLLNIAEAESEVYKRTKKSNAEKQLKELTCSYPLLKDCEKDEFFFNDNTQILLGRYFDTMPCFYKCKKNFFIMSMDIYSFFKNDMFIRYMIDKPNIFIHKKNIKLETVFPVRILLSKEHKIPTHKTRKIQKKEFTSLFIRNTIKNKNAISFKNKKLINNLPESSLIRQLITSKIPINHVIARELCILYFLDIYFYAVYDNNIPRPYLLCSKYNLEEIKKIYSLFNKPMPDIRIFMYKKRLQETTAYKKDICIKYDFAIIKNDIGPVISYVMTNVPTIQKEKFLTTFRYMWEYVGYFYLFVCDEDSKMKAFFFQNRNDREEVKKLHDIIQKKYGKESKKLLEDTIPNEKARRIRDYFKDINKSCNDYCNKDYHVIPYEKYNDWVIMNTIIWAHNHSYKASDYYGSTLFNMFSSYVQKFKKVSSVFFVNYFDGPVLHKKYKYYLIPTKVSHNIHDYYPIYSPNTTNEHADIPIPFPDSWEIATRLRFGDTCRKSFQEKPTLVPYDKKKNSIFFRGTNTSLHPNDPSINTRLFCLGQLEKHKHEFPKGFLDIGLTSLINSTFIYPDGSIEFSKLEEIKKVIPNFEFKSYYPMAKQSEFKYILEMEGVSSSWRLPYMLQLKSCIINVDSRFKRWFESFPEYKSAVYHTSRDKLIQDIHELIENDTKAKSIAENGFMFYKKYLVKDALLDYLNKIIK